MAVIDLPCGCRMYTEAEKLDYKQDRICRYHEGEAATVAAIVAWLRADSGGIISGDASENLADAIERGEHLKGGT